MKKYLSIIAASAVAVSALAQGTVVFNNSPSSIVQQWTSATDSTLMAVPRNTGFVQIFYAKQGTALGAFPGTAAGWAAANAGWSLGAIGPIGAPGGGRYSNGEKTLTGITAGSSIDYVILGWTGTAATFDEALVAGAMIGYSGKYTSSTGASGVPPAPGVPLSDSMTAGITLSPVAIPEPSTFALAGLGAAALLIFRRRN